MCNAERYIFKFGGQHDLPILLLLFIFRKAIMFLNDGVIL